MSAGLIPNIFLKITRLIEVLPFAFFENEFSIAVSATNEPTEDNPSICSKSIRLNVSSKE